MLVTGHCYLAGTQLSELSERRILGGNQHALPSAIFPADLDYVALGHLHRAQQVKGPAPIRYSGSPIPLALDEAGYRHQVLQVDLDPGCPPQVEALPVPRSVDILRLPKAGPAPLEQLGRELEQLALDSDLLPERYPYLEARVLLERPEPGLRQQIEELLTGRPLRLLKLSTSYAGSGAGLGDQLPEQTLQELDPEQVFLSRWRRSHQGEPSAELLARFRQLLEAVQEAD
jgi:exonuclease SbcD